MENNNFTNTESNQPIQRASQKIRKNFGATHYKIGLDSIFFLK